VERILHRVNTLERLRQAVDAGVDRVEIDLRYSRGKFLLSHDLPVGPVTVGRSGAQFTRIPYLLVHWDGRSIELPELLDVGAPPLYVDLKGRWSDLSLAHLTSALARFRRDDDVIASNRWSLLDRYRVVAPRRRVFYGISRLSIREFCVRLGEGNGLFGVSVDVNLLDGRECLIADLREGGVAIYVWNIRQREQLVDCETARVHGAIFDDVTWTI